MLPLSQGQEADAPASKETGVRGREQAARELEEDLREVLSGKATPVFHYQPIADVNRAVVAGYEALVRFPVRARLAPDVCLRAAGHCGFQVELETLIFRSALRAKSQLPPNSFLCVNVSPAFLASDAWETSLAEQPNLLSVVVEITEEQAVTDYESMRNRLAAIRAKGGMVAIDDAGAGYASLKHILELRPSFIKLDRNFVQNCDADRAKSTVIEMMGAAANRMDAWIIAEGVETAPELAELARLGVPLAQGYFLGRPTPSMTELLPVARHEMATHMTQRDTREDLMLLAETCGSTQSVQEAEEMLKTSSRCHLIAITDRWHRPIAILQRHPVLGTRLVPDLMRCQGSSEVGEALRRALTRDAAHRFDPVVLIDEEGRLQGTASVDRLALAALDLGKKDRPMAAVPTAEQHCH